MIILDTDVIIDYIRGFAKAQQFLDSTYKKQRYSISFVTAVELIKGARDKKAQKVAEELISKFQIVEMGETISRRCFDLVKRYHLNHSLALADSLIASSALEYRAKLLTKNLKDYDFIPKLKVESPY